MINTIFLTLNKNFVTQPLIIGVSYSANILSLKNKALILNFNKQKIFYNKKKIIFKGTEFIKKVPFENKIKKNINIISKKLPGLNSFYGIDFIISKNLFVKDGILISSIISPASISWSYLTLCKKAISSLAL